MNLTILPIRATFLKTCLTLVLCLFGLFTVAQTPITPTAWTGQGTSAAGPSAFTVLPASILPGSAVVNVSQWNRDGSLTNTVAGGCYNSNGWTLGGSLATAIAGNTDVYFTITNDAATELQITQIYIMSQVSATGPQSVQIRYTIGTTSNNFGPTIATAHTASPENWTINDNMCIGAGQTATFRLYAWGGSNPAGTLRINNGTSITANFAGAITSAPTNSSPVCPGGVINFTGMFAGGIGPYTFNWAGPASFSSTLQHPTLSPALVSSAGTYTFTVTDALGCIPSSGNTTVVTITPPPPAISGSLNVCLGSTSALSNATPGGTWSSSDVTVASVGLGTGVVLGNNLGTATITYTAASGCYTTSVVTVNPLPSAITGTLSTCVGTTTALSNATPGGTWSSTSANVSVAATGVVTGVTPGTAVVSYTLSTGCSATTIVTVTSVPAPITGPSVVCVNAAITLANAVAGGTWASNDVTIATAGVASGGITGQSSGVTTITYTVGPGCLATTQITVNPIPNVITGTAVVCEASSTSLFNSTAGGTWSSGSPLIATIGGFSGVVNGIAGGTSIITYRLTTTGCFRTRTVTVNPLPANITGPAVVCLGSSVVLSSASGGGTWSSSASATASITTFSGVVTGNILGTATITYTLPTGCLIARTMSVEPLPAPITGPLEVCAAGSTITLSDASAGGTWTSSNPTIASVDLGTGVVTGGSTPGTVTITYTLPTGCFATRGVTVNGIPAAAISPIGDTMMCPGGFVVLTAITGTGYLYQWHESGVPLPGATAPTQTVTTAGSYQVQIINPLGCSVLSIPMAVSVNPSTASITATAFSICSGSSVTLNANTGPGLTYQWLIGTPAVAVPGATSSSYGATTAGNVKVIVSNLTGCSEADSVNIIVNPLPTAVTSVTGPLVFCQGGSVMLSAISAPGYAFQWFRGGIPLPVPAGIATNYAATLSGSYHVTVTNAFGCSATSATTVVTVNPLPDVTVSHASPSVFCPGGSVTLNAALAPGFTYQWYNGGLPITGATNFNYVAATSGGYRVKVVNTVTGCFATTAADTMVTVLSSATIVPVTSEEFCWGGNAILSTSASALPYLSFQWYLNGSPISGANSSTYTASVSGSYSCRIVPPGGCTITTVTLPVIEYPLPNPTITYNTVSGLMSTETWFVTYQWYKGLALLAGATTPHIYPMGNGDYKVQVTDTNGCQSFSTVFPLRNWKGPNAVAGIQRDDISIYPNPVSSVLHIDYDLPIRAVISGIDGKMLIDVSENNIDISHLANGVYFITVYDNEGQRIAMRKVVKVQ